MIATQIAGDKIIPVIGASKLSEKSIEILENEAKNKFFLVENEIYYHLSSIDQPVGSILNWGLGKKEWEVPENLLDTERRFYDLWKNEPNDEAICAKRYKDCYRKFRSYIRAVREFILEETRRNYFPFLPSRGCHFVFKNCNTETFNFWYDELNRPDYLLKLRLKWQPVSYNGRESAV